MATLTTVTHHATSHYSPTETNLSPTETNLDLPEVTTATTNAAPSATFTPTTLLEPEISQYTKYYEGFVGGQPVKAIEDSDNLGYLPGGGNQILVTDEGLINQ
jgi:hypothetical protein